MRYLWILLLLTATCSANDCENLLLNLPGHFEKASEFTQAGTIQHKIYRIVEDGSSIGNLFYTLHGDLAHIDWNETAPEYRGQGVSKILFAEMIKDHPEIRRIEGLLVYENLKAADKEPKEKNCAERAMATPAYKLRARYGYTNILDCEYAAEAFLLLVVGK